MTGNARDLPTPSDEADEKLLSDVREHGWHVLSVPEQGFTPGWAFSIGLYHTYQHPEIVVFGLPANAMRVIVNSLATDIGTGSRFGANTFSEEVLEGFTCAFRPVHPRWFQTFLGYATWFYQGQEFPAVQCLWPDREGVLPSAPEFEPALRGAQPLLEFPDPDRARAVALLHTLDS